MPTLASSLAGQTPVIPGNAIISINDRNADCRPRLSSTLPASASSLHADARPDPANPATALPAITIDVRVPRDQAPRSPEPARFRLLHHANVVVTDGDSYRMRQARARGGTALNKK